MVDFTQVPAQTLVPFVWVELDASQARPGSGVQPYKLLIIAQMLDSGGSATALTPYLVTSSAGAAGLFGAGSQAHRMAAAVFANQPSVELWMVGMDASGGTATTWALDLTGPATGNGTVQLYLGGIRVQTAVASGDSVDTIGGAIAANINANANLEVTAAYAANTVTLTAKNKGTAAAEMDVRVNYLQGEELPAGVGITINAPTPGATDPDISTAFAALGDVHYNVLAVPFTDAANLAAIEVELANRVNPDRQIDMVAIAATNRSHANLITLAGTVDNSHMSIMGTWKSPTTHWAWAAALAAQVAFSAQNDPALPFQNTTLAGILPPVEVEDFTLLEKELLLAAGIAVFQRNAAGNAVIGRLVTTYTQTSGGAEDDTYRDLTTALTLAYFRWDLRNQVFKKFPAHKLASDDARVAPGSRIVTPRSFKAELVAIGRRWHARGLLEDFETFKSTVHVERDVAKDPNRLDVFLAPDVVNQLRVVRALLQFRL